MPWLSGRELKRIERERVAALKRAVAAEDRLAEERASKDWMITQLTSRFVTKQGGYALDHEPPSKAELPPSRPDRFIRQPTDDDYVKLEYYKRCYRGAGLDEEKAQFRWEAEMRGESVPFEYEMSEAEQ